MIILQKDRHHRFFLLCDKKEIAEVSSFLFALEARGLSIATRRAYAYDLLCFHRFLEGKLLAIDCLSPKDALDYLMHLRSIDAAPKTINRRITAVRLYLNHRHLAGNDIFASSTSFYKGRRNKALLGPARIKCASRLLRVKSPQKMVMPIPNDVIRLFFTKLRSFRDHAITSLMLFCGLRCIEIINLKTHDIDFAELKLRISGKGGKERILPFSPLVKIALERYFFFERPEGTHNSCFVVLKGPMRGCSMKPETIRKIFRHRRAILELKDVNPHRFRHTFCTSLIREKVPLPVVQKLMGHADIETTLIYTHLSLEDIHAEYQRAIKEISVFAN